MDYLDRPHGQFGNFKREDFEADWIKVAECRFGQVYRVKLKVWREKCALKVLEPNLCGESFYRRLMEEGSNLAKVRFKYMVSVYGVCSDVSALVMEFMSNGSLSNLLSTHLLMWPKKFQMIHEASMGMNFLHSMRPPLLHLNLKTSNILLDDHLHVKISDFGLVHWEEDMNKRMFMEHLTARGNIAYIPPETISQCSDPPATAFDVYSFGIVMWEILTQQKPYAGWKVTAVLLHVSDGKRPSLDALPERRPPQCQQMIGIMQQCWEQDPRKRPHFSDMVRNTEVLTEALKIPQPVQSAGTSSTSSGGTGPRLEYKALVSPVHQIALPGMCDLPLDDQYGKDGVLTLLLQKDFESFRNSLRRKHVSTSFSGNKSLLHYTVASGDAASVESVLALGAEVDCTTARGYTPLIIAVLHRLHDIISLLLEHGADVTRGDEDQWTALHFAAQSGDDRAVRLLLDKGAPAEAREKAGWTPLHLASQNGHEAAVRLLLARLPETAAQLDTEKAQVKTPLHLACMYGHFDIAKLLLSRGADPNATDASLSTSLHLATEEGHNRIVRHLLKCGAGVERADERGNTALHLAALKGHTGIGRQLVAAGADPGAKTLQGWTPLHLAALKGHGATVMQLQSQGGDVNARGQSGWTPLHLACHQGAGEATANLLVGDADPDAREDAEGWTPLHLACSAGCLDSVGHLLSYRATVNAVTSGRATPLHLAAQQGSAALVQALLRSGADRTLLDAAGLTAAGLARKDKNWEVVQLLENS